MFKICRSCWLVNRTEELKVSYIVRSQQQPYAHTDYSSPSATKAHELSFSHLRPAAAFSCCALQKYPVHRHTHARTHAESHKKHNNTDRHPDIQNSSSKHAACTHKDQPHTPPAIHPSIHPPTHAFNFVCTREKCTLL